MRVTLLTVIRTEHSLWGSSWGAWCSSDDTSWELSRRELAERAEVSYPYVSQIETGDREPSIRTMRKLAEVLQVPAEDLAGLASQGEWIGTAPSGPRMSAPRETSYDDAVDLYRAKVMPSVERRLQSVPPLVRLRLLHELQAQAMEELAGSDE